jgi:hypothetical protein
LCSDTNAQEGLGGFIKKYVKGPEVLAELVQGVFSFCEEMSKQMILAQQGAFIRYSIQTRLEQKMQKNEKKSHYKAYDSFRAIQSANKRLSRKHSHGDGQINRRKSKTTKENRSMTERQQRKIGSVGYSFLKQFDVGWFRGEVKEIRNADNCKLARISSMF